MSEPLGPVRIGKVMSLSILEVSATVQDALGALPPGGRLLSADECHLLMVQFDLYSLDPALRSGCIACPNSTVPIHRTAGSDRQRLPAWSILSLVNPKGYT
ncbi:MAG TPA: hypothetical protein VML54_12050 [Candidatus Limnocylindrales bacterium]|nr:hypothetical protein [Candidatus Limnocylindrales bacterium]